MVKVKDLLFPVDFVIIDMEEDVAFPFILGQLFLYKSRSVIDMNKWKLCMGVGENEVVFKFPINPTPSSYEKDTLFCINHTNRDVSRSLLGNQLPPSKNPKDLKGKEKAIFPKSKKRGLMMWVPIPERKKERAKMTSNS